MANPPAWLGKQFEVYRKAPDHYLLSLCAAVAAVILGDATWAEEMREEVEKELGL